MFVRSGFVSFTSVPVYIHYVDCTWKLNTNLCTALRQCKLQCTHVQYPVSLKNNHLSSTTVPQSGKIVGVFLFFDLFTYFFVVMKTYLFSQRCLKVFNVKT